MHGQKRFDVKDPSYDGKSTYAEKQFYWDPFDLFHITAIHTYHLNKIYRREQHLHTTAITTTTATATATNNKQQHQQHQQ